jgi:hypothetical protein
MLLCDCRAMNPSGASTNGTCGGFSTGEPFREVIVHACNDECHSSSVCYATYAECRTVHATWQRLGEAALLAVSGPQYHHHFRKEGICMYVV